MLAIHIKQVGTLTGTGERSAYVVTGDGQRHAISRDLASILIRSARTAGAAVNYHHHGAHDVWRFNGEEGISFLPTMTLAIPA